MSFPTVPVTVILRDMGGNPCVGVAVSAKLDVNEIYEGFVIAETFTSTTDDTGTAVLHLFPNNPSTGLGTQGSTYTFRANPPGGKSLNIQAQVPNSACTLDAIMIVDQPVPPLTAAQQAMNSAQASAGTAATSATQSSASATAAASSATAAQTAATAAQGSQNAASTSETNAAASATSAGNSATSASGSAASAVNSASGASSSAAAASDSETNASVSAGEASTSATSASASANTATTAASSASTNATAAAASASQAGTSATNAATSAASASTNATAAQTSATNAATSAAGAATSASGASASATNASNSATAAAGSASAANASAAAASGSAATAATHETNAGTSSAAAAGSASAASTSAGQAATSATNAAASATAAAGSAASTLAIYGTSANMNAQAAATANALTQSSANALTAIAQAGLASIYALSAASVAQQDLSGVTAAALHRSPNAVVAMCIDDPRTHSDGGAWTSKVDHLSWMNEPLNGAWINAANGVPTEMLARALGGTLGATNLATTNVAADWTPGANNVMSAGTAGPRCTVTVGGANAQMSRTITGLTIGKTYAFYAVLQSPNSAGVSVRGGSSLGIFDYFAINGHGGVFVATTTNLFLNAFTSTSGVGVFMEIASVFVKEVTAFAPSGSYYPSATDGKFYRVWKNLLKYSEDLTQAAWAKTTVTVTAGISDPNGGTSAFRLTATGNGASCYQQLAAANIPATVSIMVRRVSGTGAVSIMSADGTTSTPITGTLTGVWQRFTAPATNPNGGATLYSHTVVISAVGDVVDVAFPQAQYGGAFDSYESKQADQTQTEVFRGNVGHYGRTAWVAEAGRLVGYAIDQPGRPAWMSITTGANFMLQGTITSVAATNGALVVGTNSGAFLINFAKDAATKYSTAADATFQGRISSRGVANGYL